MPSPFTAGQSPISTALPAGVPDATTTTSTVVDGLSGSSRASIRTLDRTLDVTNSPSRRWSRVQRRSPLNTHLLPSLHHSPRSRHSSSPPLASRSGPLLERHQHHFLHEHQYRHPPASHLPRGLTFPLSSPSYQHMSSASHSRRALASARSPAQTPSPPSSVRSISPPAERSLTTTTTSTTTATTSSTSNIRTTYIALRSPSPSPSDNQQHLHRAPFDLSMRMDSSGPSDSLTTLVSEDVASQSSHQQPVYPSRTGHTGHRSQVPGYSALSSTPMQRSLSNNPAMATNVSSIAATRPDSSSVLISISSSSPVSSVILSPAFTPASPPSSGGARLSQEQAIVAVPGRDHTVNLISINARSPHSTTQHPYQQHQTSTAATRDIFNGDRDDHDPEVDDRIHFRLLNNIFFSSSTRHAGHDRDGSVSPNTAATISHSGFGSRATDRRHAIDFRNISTSGENDTHMTDAMEDGIEYGLHSPTSVSSDLLADRSDDFQSAVLRTRSNRPDPLWEDVSGNNNFDDNDPDDDEDDDGIDQVIESRRRHDARAYTLDMDIPASLSFSNPTTPFHAALSPRSAAALNNALTGGHFAESSISSDLTALSQQGPSDDYGSNPYFRRVPSSYPSRTITEHRQPAISPAGVRLDSMNHYSSELHDDASTSRPTPGSVSMQFNRINLDYSSHRGCGENAPVSNIETRGDVWPLKFEMYYADGGEFNAAHSVENVLKNDSSVYCSRRSTNINICLKLAEPRQTFVLTQFKAKAPTTGFTAPCKEGLIFISHEPIPLEKTAFFDNMTRERYNEYMEDIHHGAAFKQLLQSHGAGADSIVPAAFFQVDGPDETCTLDFTPNRSGRYVLIKLLRSRCTNALQRPENIDLQYLGLIGFTGARSFASGGLL